MVIVSSLLDRRPEGRSGPLDGPDDACDQGEFVVLPLKFVVAPDHGRFHPASLPTPANGSLTIQVRRGVLIGEVHNGPLRLPVHSPFDGHLNAWLVVAGQIVIPGQPVCSLLARSPGRAGNG